MNRPMHRTVLAALACCCLTFSACSINPATGKRQLVLMGEQQEIQLGMENDKQIVQSMGLYDDDALQEYVQQLGARLAAKSERPSLAWSFRVVDDPTVNAFALPGGFIYVTRGILAHLNSEAELASVIGHEIGHVTARHGVNQMSKAQLFQLGLGVGLMVSEGLRQYAQEAQQALSLLFLKYSRDDERQADDLGLRYLTRGGYDPRPMPEVFEVLKRVGEAEGGGRAPAWLTTHPAPENRKETIAAEIAAMNQDFTGLPIEQAAYYGRIDDIVFGADPREGYFKENAFLHPGLKFRLDFPPGWNAQNTKQVVLAVSPEQDAVVQLTLAGPPTAAEAIEKFLGQQGVRPGASGPSRIHGLPARSQDFSVQTEQGVLQGRVAFIEYEGKVYEVLGYTAEADWERHGRSMSESLSSFDRLTDRAALAVQPKRLKLVEARQSMSLAEFAERHQATVSPETLARINHLDADDRIQAGRRYKIVTGGVVP